jgi:conjugative relaxase-like TrwC/TraI family protein
VTEDQLRSLYRGFDPATQEPLVANAGAQNRQPCWDLTFSAPKPVSVFWSRLEEEYRREIEQCHTDAVNAALDYAEEHLLLTRTGPQGIYAQHAKGVFAVFRHCTNRLHEPLLHSHALLLNVAVRDDGNTSAVHSRLIFRWRDMLGALYRKHLGELLQTRLGIRLEQDRLYFSVAGIDRELVKAHSTRRKEILEQLADRGLWRIILHI